MIGVKICLTLLSLASFVKGESTCCTVSQWESVQEFLSGSVGGGKAVETEGHTLLSYDRDRQMINAVVSLSDGHVKRTDRYLYDFKNKTQYIIDEAGKCQASTLTFPMDSGCVSAGAKRENTFYLGSAKQPLNVIQYRLPQTGPQLGFMSVTPTAKNCIPVTEILYAGGENPMMITYSFNNFTEGIKSPTVFDIPPQCKHAAFGNMIIPLSAMLIMAVFIAFNLNIWGLPITVMGI